MADAIGETGDRVVAAIGEIHRHRIAERPAAGALGKFGQGAGMRAFDRCAKRDRCDAIGRLQAGELEHAALRRSPRAAGARRAALRRRTRGPPRRQPQPMDFSDHRVAADADLGGDLAAGQSGDDTMAELLDALRGPGRGRWRGGGSNGHSMAPCCDGRSGPPAGRRLRALGFCAAGKASGVISANDGGQAPSFTEPD